MPNMKYFLLNPEDKYFESKNNKVHLFVLIHLNKNECPVQYMVSVLLHICYELLHHLVLLFIILGQWICKKKYD